MSATVETPSGKAARDENFPVGSWLIRAELRPHVHAFYRFAREADDIADNSALSADEKVHRLDRMGEVLEGGRGEDAPSARAMRDSLIETGVTAQHCHDILRAFRLDATKLRYKDWDDLMGYCRYSASPVGRQVLDLHGESRDTWPPNDALCSALQVLNHLQDCVADYHDLDRVYLPTELLERFGSGIADLDLPAASPGLRATLDHLLDQIAELVREARGLPPRVVSAGLRRETAVIVNLAERLTQRLRRGDPVAGRVKLTPYDFGASVLVGLWRGRQSRALP
jgi:farnesyl-diphosphate farnesyltransferase